LDKKKRKEKNCSFLPKLFKLGNFLTAKTGAVLANPTTRPYASDGTKQMCHGVSIKPSKQAVQSGM
jgi:hypothetical protein